MCLLSQILFCIILFLREVWVEAALEVVLYLCLEK